MDNKNNNKKYVKQFWFWVIAIFFLLGACGSFFIDNEDEEKSKKTSNENVNNKKEEKEKEIFWEEKITEIAKSDNSETEKHDEAVLLSKKYKVSKEELELFQKYIINEYESKVYLKDIKNHEYMLKNIFISNVIEKYYDDKLKNPIDNFAFDFYQNTKYIYRGVDDVNSESVIANEQQMDKTLKEIK